MLVPGEMDILFLCVNSYYVFLLSTSSYITTSKMRGLMQSVALELDGDVVFEALFSMMPQHAPLTLIRLNCAIPKTKCSLPPLPFVPNVSLSQNISCLFPSPILFFFQGSAKKYKCLLWPR